MSKKNQKKNLSQFEIPELDNPCKTLLANIRFAGVDRKIKTICITSSIPGEGKTLTAANLAVAMATSGKRTLLIENDMRRRCLGKMLNIETNAGLYSLLSGRANLNSVIVRTHIPNLFFLDAEHNVPNPADVLSSKRYASLIRHLREQFDYIVMDTPPTSTFPDSSIVSTVADGTAFVIRRKSTKRKMVQKSLAQLAQANANLLGTIITFCDPKDEDYYYYYSYYNEEGKKVRSSKGGTPEVDSMIEGANELSRDLDEDSLEEWEKRMGFTPTSKHSGSHAGTAQAARTTRQAHPARQNQVPQTSYSYVNNAGSQQYVSGSNPGATYGAPTQGNPYAQGNAAAQGNPYAPGSFKAPNQSWNRNDRAR